MHNHLKGLKRTLAAFTANGHDTFRVTFQVQNGEPRNLDWLTETDAANRAEALAARGYTVTVGPMFAEADDVITIPAFLRVRDTQRVAA